MALALCLAVVLSQAQSKARRKPVHKAQGKRPPKRGGSQGSGTPAGERRLPQPREKKQPRRAKRDPFLPLISEKKEGGTMEHLPPGKAGLVITTVRVDGTVRSPEGMIAVLSNADQHVYFVREGDQLYDGEVDKIGLDGVTFRQNSKDAFGKPVERVVTKRIYASAGEQQ